MCVWKVCLYERVYTAINAQRGRNSTRGGNTFQGRLFTRCNQSRIVFGFYIAEALLNEKGLRYSKHGTVHGAFAQHFIKTKIFDDQYHKSLTGAFRRRMLGDYEEVSRFSSDEVMRIIEQAWDFLKTAKDYFASQE
jgi:uncharacterized protein (UPF0332 family)